jgi:hypothetical protein
LDGPAGQDDVFDIDTIGFSPPEEMSQTSDWPAGSSLNINDGVSPMRQRSGIVCLVVLLAGSAPSARADLTIYLQDTNVQQGGYGTMNIYVSGTPSDTFNDYQLQLQITGSNIPPDILEFAPNPNTPGATSRTQDYSHLNAPNYLFPSDSGDASASGPGGFPEDFKGLPNNIFIAGDFTLSGNSYYPSANVPTINGPNTNVTLLASLLLYAPSALPTDTYTVSVSAADSSNPTYFNTNFDSSTDLNYVLSTASGFAGTVTIGSAVTVVPEPASTVFVLTAVPLYLGYQRMRRLLRSKAGSA